MPFFLHSRWISFPILLTFLALVNFLKPSISQGQSILDIKSCPLNINIFRDRAIRLDAKTLSISDQEISIDVEGRNNAYPHMRCTFYCTTKSEDGQISSPQETKIKFFKGKLRSFTITCPPLTNKNADKLLLTIERNANSSCGGGTKRLPAISWKNCKSN